MHFSAGRTRLDQHFISMAEGAEQEMSTHMTEMTEVSQEDNSLGIHSPRIIPVKHIFQ
jgi:hypothetical protein